MLQALSQFSHESDSHSISSTDQSSASNYVASTNPIRYRSTRIRTILAPDRFGFDKPTPQPPKQNDDVSSALSSLRSSMSNSEPSCYANDVDISSFVSKELEEISVMTKSLNEMMNTTEQLILSLQNDTRSSNVTAPPQIPAFVYTGNSTASLDTEVTPNNAPLRHLQVPKMTHSFHQLLRDYHIVMILARSTLTRPLLQFLEHKKKKNTSMKLLKGFSISF